MVLYLWVTKELFKQIINSFSIIVEFGYFARYFGVFIGQAGSTSIETQGLQFQLYIYSFIGITNKF